MSTSTTRTPAQSWTEGLVACAVVFAVIGSIFWYMVASVFDFLSLGSVLGPVAGLVAGGTAAYTLFSTRLRTVPLYWVGVELVLGKPGARVFGHGNHWVPPFCELLNVPDQEQIHMIEMPHEKINTQDGSLVYFGVGEEKEEKKRNRVQYSIVNPLEYVQVVDPEDALRESYLEQARIFFSQAAAAIGIKNEKTLFSDFVMLPCKTGYSNPADAAAAQTAHDRFKDRLTATKYQDEATKASLPLFAPTCVDTIMANAGEFRERAATWGIGGILAFTPNVRANPEAEEAAAKKSAAEEEMASLETRATKIRELAKAMHTEAKVTPDLAATLVAGMHGEKVTVSNTTHAAHYPGMPEAIRAVGEAIADALRSKKE